MITQRLDDGGMNSDESSPFDGGAGFVRAANIPSELRQRPQWVCWKRIDGRKVPVQPNGRNASSTDPATWCDFATAVAAANDPLRGFAGVGYVFAADDGYVGVDFDGCIDERGNLAPWTAPWLTRLNSYTEVSPSGAGVKVWMRGSIAKSIKLELPADCRVTDAKEPGIEVYDRGRYFTVTGQVLEKHAGPIRENQGTLDELVSECEAIRTKQRAPKKMAPAPTLVATSSPNRLDVLDRVRKYLANVPGAVSGRRGHEATFRVARLLVNEWALDESTAWIALSEWNMTCDPPWDEHDLRRKLDEASKLGADGNHERCLRESPSFEEVGPAVDISGISNCMNDAGTGEPAPRPLMTLDSLPIDADIPWPDVLSDDALHGLAGDFVRTVQPDTEADPAALLGHVLAYFGAIAGPNRYQVVESHKHHPRMFLLCVGKSAKGRKGTASRIVESFFEPLRDGSEGNLEEVFDFFRNCKQSGLSSGEGLIHAVRDAALSGTQGRQVDAGAFDKRLLVVEGEFGGALMAARREGSMLTAIVRDAWDSGNLQTLTKSNPCKATGAHITIVGHISRDELRMLLSRVDVANGFANRFLMIAVHRSKLLPHGGRDFSEAIWPIRKRLREAIRFAQEPGEMHRTESGRTLWAKAYPDLSQDRYGLSGSLLARAEAQVTRLSLLYALLDCSEVVDEVHLRAALAFWRYSEQSVGHIFGAKTGDAVADELLAMLHDAGDQGLTRTDINLAFQKNRRAPEIRRALEVLASSRLAFCRNEVKTRGRPAERWFLGGPG